MTTDTEALVRRAYHFADGAVLDVLPDVHRELHRVNVLGDVVAIELSIRGTFLGPFEMPAGDRADGGQARHPDRRLLVRA